MKILCTLKEAANLIRACQNASCYNCVLAKTCNETGLADKSPENLILIVPEETNDGVDSNE